MEIIFWFLFAYIVYYSYSRKTEVKKLSRNAYLICTGVLGLCMWCFFRLLLKVDHLSVWFLLAFAALSAQAAYTLGQRLLGNTALRKLIVPSAKTLAGG